MGQRILIIGGVAGGASAAARARRMDEDAQIIMFERGEYISFANCGLPYYIGGVITDRDDLIVTEAGMFRRRFNVDVRTMTEVTSVDTDNKKLKAKDLATGRQYEEKYDKLILSQGAEPIKPPLEGIDNDRVFTLRNIPDADRIKEFIDENKPEKAVVVGGGFIGLEMAENLAHRGIKVTVIEMLDQVMAPVDPEMAKIVEDYLDSKGVRLQLNDGVKSFAEKDGGLIVTTTKGANFNADMVILSVGVKPENKLAKDAGLKVGKRGGIKTNEYMQTSDPDIYAVGDAAEINDFVLNTPTQIPLAGPANKQGRIAATNATGGKMTYSGAQGTSAVKVFNLVVGSTGVNEKTLKRLDKKYEKVYAHSPSHASYYPGSAIMASKMLYDPDNGKILGAQIVGMDGVDKRVDVLATAIRAGMTVFDLEELELTYAPPFSSAKDPVNMLGFIASNIMRGDMDAVSWTNYDQLKDDYQIVDVREKPELEISGKAEHAVHIPLHKLRKKLDTLDKDRKYALYCGSGHRSYIGARILRQKGVDAVNISGGYKSYMQMFGKNKPEDDPDRHDNQGGSNTKEKTVAKKQSGVPPVKLTSAVKGESDSGENGKTKAENVEPDVEVNACGLQCPGPIMKMKKKMEKMEAGQVMKISASDPGFYKDAESWAQNTNNQLMGLSEENGVITALIRKGNGRSRAGASEADKGAERLKDRTIVVFSNDLDRVMASFIIANGAASMGRKVTMFFTFWGLNVLRKRKSNGVEKNFVERMFGALMPKGPEELTLSKMNMGGMGTAMMKHVMENKNVQSLDMLIKSALDQGVKLVACTMTMDIMGIKREELIDGVEEGGVATYLHAADSSNVNLFI